MSKQQLTDNKELQVSSPGSVGRPKAVSHAVVRELVYWFGVNADVKTACAISGISTSTYYKELAENPTFSDKMTIARQQINLYAGTAIASAIERGDLKTIRWWIDREDRRERHAQRAKEYRYIKKLTVTKSHTETQSVEVEFDTLVD